MKWAREIALGLLFLFALAGGITLLLRGSPPKALEIILPTAISGSVSERAEASGLINVNSATLREIESLYGIGSEKAQAIIDYREQHGPFKTVDDLLKVKGIGTKTLENIRHRITVE